MNCLLGACVIATHISSGGSYTELTPVTATDSANVVHNISHFYKVENQQFSMGGYLILDTNTRIDLNYDNGLKSQKRTRSKALTVGITQLAIINKSNHIAFGVSTKLGGRTTEIACTDDSGTDRQFFCDNLSTLQPFEQPKHNKNIKVSVNYKYKF